MDFGVAYSGERHAARMAEDLLAGIDPAFGGRSPKAMIVFAAPDLGQGDVLARLARRHPSTIVIGASSAGEFADGRCGHGQVSLMAIGGDDVSVSSGIGRGLSRDTAAAAGQLVAGFDRSEDTDRPYRSALVMADALSGRMDELVHDLTVATGGEHKFFGGGAGDNAAFARTTVFIGGEVATDAAVALEIRSAKPIGVGAHHGWVPATAPWRVTEAEGTRLVSLDGLPAVTAFEDHAEATGQGFDAAAPIPFFLHNILGICTGGQHRLRVPLQVHADGSISCAAQIPTGALVSIMRSGAEDAMAAARMATATALSDLGAGGAAGALMFDCVATRLRLGASAPDEVDAVRGLLPGVPLAGCHTHGQIVRGLGQFAAFQNCTAVVCLLPN